MLTASQLMEFKNLSDKDQILNMDEVLLANIDLNIQGYIQNDDTPGRKDSLILPHVAFSTSCHLFNVLLGMQLDDYNVEHLNDNVIKEYINTAVFCYNPNSVSYGIQEILYKDWNVDRNSNIGTDLILRRAINALKLNDVKIDINDLNINIKGDVVF